MPVYEQGYESYTGRRCSRKARWFPLFLEEVTPFLKKRRFLFLLLLALIPWIYGVALTFLHTQLGAAGALKGFVRKLPVVNEKLVASLLGNGYEIFLLFIVVIWVGAGLVARDRRDKTLELFLSRALGSFQYLWAKGAALGFFLLLLSLVPVLVLVTFQVGLTGEAGWLLIHFRVLWGTLLYTLLGPGTIVLFVLAISSLARSPRTAGLTFIGVVFLSDVACGVIFDITREHAVWFFSVAKELSMLADRCLGAPVPSFMAINGLWTVLFFVLLAVGSGAVLTRRFSGRGVLR